MTVRKAEKEFLSVSESTATGTKVTLWWLRHYESIVQFWRGFSWVLAVGIVLFAIVGHMHLRHALFLLLVIGVIGASGIYLGIRTMASHLKGLKEGREKEEAHELMMKIIRRRIVDVG
ncbi:MAG: hypothetical protein SWE60_06450 [Thermodesulfobacteriota bacterium]|nr:hypothetical protein [Thermodesulfobacteriota bacterium]